MVIISWVFASCFAHQKKGIRMHDDAKWDCVPCGDVKFTLGIALMFSPIEISILLFMSCSCTVWTPEVPVLTFYIVWLLIHDITYI